MDNRTRAQELQSFIPITAANLPQHFSEVEQALKLEPDTLRNLFGTYHLDELANNLDIIQAESIQSARKSISECVAQTSESDEVIKFFRNQSTHLNSILDNLAQHLTAQKQTAMSQYAEQIKSAQQQLGLLCKFGNDALTLDTLKHNIVLALQNAAYYSHLYWSDLSTNREAFNNLFIDVAWINPEGKLALFPGALRDFSALNIPDLLIKLNSILAASRQHANPIVSRIMQEHLTKLAAKQSAGFFRIENNLAIFTDKAHELERSAALAAKTAQEILNKLEKMQESRIFEYENDAVKLEQFQLIRDIISRSRSGNKYVYDVTAQTQTLASALNQDCKEIQELLLQIEDIAERGPEDSRAATAAMLEKLEFTPVMRKKIIDGMHEVFINFHQAFQQKHRPTFLFEHYSALASQLTAMQAVLKSTLYEALTHLPPFEAEIQRIKQMGHHRNELKKSIIDLYNTVDEINAEYNKINELFTEARQEFFKFLTDIQQNEWRGDLLQRLDATLLDIDDLIKKYSDHPVFKHTSLDDVIIELMREAREQTLATRETVEPDFIPPALLPERKLTITERYPNAKKILFSAAIGLGVAVLATLAVAAVFFTLGFGILPVATVAIIFTCTAIAAGAGGTAAGLGIYNKLLAPNKSKIESKTALAKTSTTADTFRKLNIDGRQQADGYDSDDEREEVVADYSNHVIFVGDPPGYEPVRQRLT